MFTKEQLQTIGELVIQGGKSPHTGYDGLTKSVMVIGWLQQAAAEIDRAALQSPRSSDETVRG